MNGPELTFYLYFTSQVAQVVSLPLMWLYRIRILSQLNLPHIANDSPLLQP